MTEAASETIARAARAAVARAVKERARAYARRPAGLEGLRPGLAGASVATLVAVTADLVQGTAREPRRWLGFGGETTLLNAKAALLLGRTLRRRAGPPPKSGARIPCGLANRGGDAT